MISTAHRVDLQQQQQQQQQKQQQEADELDEYIARYHDKTNSRSRSLKSILSD
jgi:hypothetical protein